MSLRRFTFEGCTKSWGHDAKVSLEQVPYPLANNLDGESRIAVDHGDARWPAHCTACGYAFVEGDEWQVNKTRLYRRLETGELMPLSRAPAGAMWFASWLQGMDDFKSPDGNILVLRTPGGDWVVDGPASGGGGHWTRTGVPPKVTANPSIICDSYHGWLRDGYLEEC